MKILVLGHGDHGKNVVAQLLEEMYGLRSLSTSEAGMTAVWPVLGEEYASDCGGDVVAARAACYADRKVRRMEWREIIAAFNAEDPARLVRSIVETHDVCVGLRHNVEFMAARALFDHILWVHRPGFPLDASLDITLSPTTMVPIINAGSLDLLRGQLRKYFGEPRALPVEEAVSRNTPEVHSAD